MMDERRETQLEEALHNLLTIFDSDEMKGQAFMAAVHGYSCTMFISVRNQKWIDAARALLKEQT